jgi:hypothetical protein
MRKPPVPRGILGVTSTNWAMKRVTPNTLRAREREFFKRFSRRINKRIILRSRMEMKTLRIGNSLIRDQIVPEKSPC